MLIAMSQNPNEIENVKLANNAGYLGESLDGLGNIRTDASQLYGKLVTAGAKTRFPNEMKDIGSNLDSGEYEEAMPKLKSIASQMGLSGGGGGSSEGRAWVDSIANATAKVYPLFMKKPKTQRESGGGGGGEGGGSDNTMTYVLIGGGVLIGGILLYSMFKKPGKKK